MIMKKFLEALIQIFIVFAVIPVVTLPFGYMLYFLTVEFKNIFIDVLFLGDSLTLTQWSESSFLTLWRIIYAICIIMWARFSIKAYRTYGTIF